MLGSLPILQREGEVLFHLRNRLLGNVEAEFLFCAREIEPEPAPCRVSSCGGEQCAHFRGGIARRQWRGVRLVLSRNVVGHLRGREV